ncbi:hypothetical protein IL306_003352 [Fusarium sp. DS 682]|nr:hypothetical protein IL306_003352 [Fusarium sp. DS 682]
MEALKNAEALPAYPSSPSNASDGKYAIRSTEGGYVESDGPEIESDTWFKTPPLDIKTIQRLHSLQLITESHDQGWCDNRAEGNWTWFEVSVLENADATEPRVKDDVQLSWSSHKNELESKDFVALEGILFSQDHDVFRLLEENNVIAVRLCSRFQGWHLVAKQGYLVVELGPPMKREPLGFGTIAAKVLSAQDAFNSINEVMFPDVEQLPSVPEFVFKADRMGTKPANERPLRVLSLDGGGIRGLATLKILKRIMDRACPGKKPCEVFGMIGGTSTGGMIAIMLGRLEMTIDKCIETYEDLMGKIFPKSFSWYKPLDYGTYASIVVNGEKWESLALEEIIKDLIRKQLGKDPETVLLQDPDNPDPSCKVFVTAVKETGANTLGPVLLRSYSIAQEMPEFPDIKLWEAARATSAAPTYFKPLVVNGVTLVDGGLQANNPLGWLWNEVLKVFTAVRMTDCFLSIGTGTPLSEKLPFITSPLGMISALGGIAANRDVVNLLFRCLIDAFAPRGTTHKYWRFDFGDGLPDWAEVEGVGKWVYLTKREETELGDIDDIDLKDMIIRKTEEYMSEPGFEKQLADCAAALERS